MENYTKYALIAAGASIAAKLTYFFGFYPNEDWDMYTRFAFLLFFLMSIFLSLRSERINNHAASFNSDVKTGMKATSIYAIIFSAFTWIYYKWINPAYFEGRISDIANAMEEAGEISENAINTAEFVFNAFTHSTITLFGMMVIGFFYTIVLVLLLRRQSVV